MIGAYLIRDPRSRLLLGLGVTLLIVVGQVQALEPNPRPAGLALQGTLVAAILAGWWGNTWRPRLAWTALLLVASLGLEAVRPGPTAIVGIVIGLIQLGTRVLPQLGLPVSALVLLLFELATHHRSAAPLEVAFNALSFGAAYLGAYGFRLLREQQAQTQSAPDQLQAGREAQLEAAKTEERARLAREIHDVLAHTLSALSVQLEGARLLLEQRPGDPEGLRTVGRAQHLAHEGLEEARRAIGTLRGEGLPGPDALGKLAADFERNTSVRCRLEVAGEPVPLPADARLALYRTAQEALTNVRKHARARDVRLRLAYGGGGAELTVENDGEAKVAPVKSGYGLVGMRERAELLGGRLDAGPEAGGRFQVRLWLPAN